MKAIKHVFFDLDHTLWDFDKNSALTFDKIFKTHQLELCLDAFLDVYEAINLEYWRRYRNEEIDQATLRYGRLRETFDSINLTVSDKVIHQLSVDYIEHLSTFNHLLEGALDILGYLQPKYHLHIITNGFQEAQMKKMNASAITSYFKTITNADEAGVKKPHPIIFDHALHLAKALPQESLMIGDNYEADICGALEVGYDAIFFNSRNDVVTSDIKQVAHLSELKQYL